MTYPTYIVRSQGASHSSEADVLKFNPFSGAYVQYADNMVLKEAIELVKQLNDV